MATKMLNIRQVAERIGLGMSTIWRKVANGEFPSPVQIGKQARRWPEPEVEAWLASREKLDVMDRRSQVRADLRSREEGAIDTVLATDAANKIAFGKAITEEEDAALRKFTTPEAIREEARRTKEVPTIEVRLRCQWGHEQHESRTRARLKALLKKANPMWHCAACDDVVPLSKDDAAAIGALLKSA